MQQQHFFLHLEQLVVDAALLTHRIGLVYVRAILSSRDSGGGCGYAVILPIVFSIAVRLARSPSSWVAWILCPPRTWEPS